MSTPDKLVDLAKVIKNTLVKLSAKRDKSKPALITTLGLDEKGFPDDFTVLCTGRLTDRLAMVDLLVEKLAGVRETILNEVDHETNFFAAPQHTQQSEVELQEEFEHEEHHPKVDSISLLDALKESF